MKEDVHIGSRKAIEGIESKSCVLDKNRPVNLEEKQSNDGVKALTLNRVGICLPPIAHVGPPSLKHTILAAILHFSLAISWLVP